PTRRSSDLSVEPARAGRVPPSINAPTESPSRLRTSSAVMADGHPLRLALVAVIGRPSRATSSVASRAAGHRRPTVFVPAVTLDGTEGAEGTITVKGPGQNCRATA